MVIKACYLDSNICIAYLQKIHPFHRQSVDLVKTLVDQESTIILSSLTSDETIHILIRDARKLKIPQPETKIKNQITSFFQLPRTSLINPPDSIKLNLKIFLFISKYKLKTRDAYHLFNMKHHKIKYFATFDHDFDLVFTSKTLKQFSSLPPPPKTP